jgi:hypothetical protein
MRALMTLNSSKEAETQTNALVQHTSGCAQEALKCCETVLGLGGWFVGPL